MVHGSMTHCVELCGFSEVVYVLVLNSFILIHFSITVPWLMLVPFVIPVSRVMSLCPVPVFCLHVCLHSLSCLVNTAVVWLCVLSPFLFPCFSLYVPSLCLLSPRVKFTCLSLSLFVCVGDISCLTLSLVQCALCIDFCLVSQI